MGLPPACVSLNAACRSEPLLCLLDRAGLWGDKAQGPSGSEAERYSVFVFFFTKGFNIDRFP